jgi:meso-butanediol dehydrogenase / (S,S)-butanediol dehydrogenase / diacetyl reductase
VTAALGADHATPSTGRLGEKVAVITGASSGIGRAAALAFAREGAAVALGSRDDRAGGEVANSIAADGGRAIFRETDVSRPEDVEDLVGAARGEFGRVDVLYANAGVLETGTAPDTGVETWRRVIDVNLAGQFHLAKFGVPALVEAGGGAIIFTASELGLVGASECVAYCAAKGGVVNMTRAVAIDCAPHGIRVNCLCPGPIRTKMIERFFSEADDPGETERRQVEPVLLKRLGDPEEIAQAAVHLASEESSYMTGAVQVVDGGATAWYGL